MKAWRWLVGAALLGVVVWRVGGGPVLDGLHALDAGVLLLGALVAGVTTSACAWRWHLVASELGVPVSLPAAVAACYRAQLLNTVLPGGVIGDVHRGLAHGREAGETSRALRAVAWERLAGQVVQAVAAVAVLVLLPSPVRWLLPWVALATGGAVAVAALAGRTWPVLREDARIALLARRTWPGIVTASLVALAGYAATYALAARAVGVEAPLTTMLPLVVVVLVAAGLPLNVAGWGPREGMAAWVFAAAGLGAGTGLATAVAYGAIVLVGNLPGAVVLLADVARRGVVRPPAPPVDEEAAVHA